MLDHLLLTVTVFFMPSYNLHFQVAFGTLEWYRCTLTALSKGEESTLKEILTVPGINSSTSAAAWTKVDDVLSTDALGRLERVHFLDEKKKPIETWSYPRTVRMLKQALPKLSKGGKLAV